MAAHMQTSLAPIQMFATGLKLFLYKLVYGDHSSVSNITLSNTLFPPLPHSAPEIPQ